MALPVLPGYGTSVPARARREMDGALTAVVMKTGFKGTLVDAEQVTYERVVKALCDGVDYAERQVGDHPIKAKLVGDALLRYASNLGNIQRSR